MYKTPHQPLSSGPESVYHATNSATGQDFADLMTVLVHCPAKTGSERTVAADIMWGSFMQVLVGFLLHIPSVG